MKEHILPPLKNPNPRSILNDSHYILKKYKCLLKPANTYFYGPELESVTRENNNFVFKFKEMALNNTYIKDIILINEVGMLIASEECNSWVDVLHCEFQIKVITEDESDTILKKCLQFENFMV